ncbi:MAG: BadF/BadG/BcrA/BcrD ATPase family protein, partial [Pseudomonadota bacterium]
MLHENSVLAVDGGGTRCRIALDWETGRHVVEVGSANASSDTAGALREIRAGLDAIGVALGLSLSDLQRAPAFLGLAGVTGSEIAGSISRALRFEHMRVEDDRMAALRGALGNDDGAIAHCGTGSFLALQVKGAARLCGGWGPRLGDEASAQWVGAQALKATLDAEDDVGPASDLTRNMIDLMGTTGAIVEFAAIATPAEIGQLAKEVTALAEQNDQVARSILSRGAAYIATTIDRLGWRRDMVVC